MPETIKNKRIQLSPRQLLDISISLREVIFISIVVFCLSPLASPPLALLLGLLLALFIGHPYKHLNSRLTPILLQGSVVGLGFGMNATTAVNAGKEGAVFTLFTIAGTLLAGYLVSKALKIEKKTSFLISAGTAICGGSAIAAVSPVIKAEEKQISIALGTIFILNSIALFIFPVIGHFLHLSQNQFGMWCAIAIHDTSSVVGAAGKYGTEALGIATTVKLVRTLWIIPVAIMAAYLFNNKKSKIKIPYFIGLFVVAMLISTYLPEVQAYSQSMVSLAKAGLTLTLFLIGSGLSKEVLKSVGFRPLLQGIGLWILISIVSLIFILFYV
jgi:uncharacterized integral membrane protein (TIGR00698 family)